MLKTSLVTGASGFIGRALSKRLSGDGVPVRALMRHDVTGPWQDARLLDLGADAVPASVLEDVDTVFHLAGKAHAVSAPGGGGNEHHRITVEGTRRLLDVAGAAGVKRLVFFSSVKAMGEGSGPDCLDEDAPCRPETPYGRARLEAERLVLNFARDSGCHGVVLRLTLVYGPGARGNLEQMLSAIAGGRFPPLPETGNRRSMVHVEDVVDLALRACQEPRASGQVYIVSDGRDYSTREIYLSMLQALGKPGPAWSVPRPLMATLARVGDMIGAVRGRRFRFDTDAWHKLCESACYSPAKAERELGFRASRSLRDALPGMVAALQRAP